MSVRIVPTICRIVLYADPLNVNDAGLPMLHPAIITGVMSDTTVDLTVFWNRKAPSNVNGVVLGHAAGQWSWPIR